MFAENYWIALSDIQEEGIWVWMETKTPISQTGFTYWHTGQPNNSDQNQNCGTIYGTYAPGYWNDWNCNDNNALYICEKQDRYGVSF